VPAARARGDGYLSSSWSCLSRPSTRSVPTRSTHQSPTMAGLTSSSCAAPGGAASRYLSNPKCHELYFQAGRPRFGTLATSVLTAVNGLQSPGEQTADGLAGNRRIAGQHHQEHRESIGGRALEIEQNRPLATDHTRPTR